MHAAADRLLRRADGHVLLLDRCRPANEASERERLVTLWERGVPSLPAWRYTPPPDLTPLVRALEEVDAHPERFESWRAARARELLLETRLVLARGTPAFGRLAAERFPIDGSEDGARAEAASEAWSRLAPPAPPSVVDADDAGHPESLISELRRTIGRLRLPLRVEVKPDLASAAATTDGVVTVRSRVAHAPAAARRIAHHEIQGHALPRIRAQCEGEIDARFAVATAGASDDEEGRALLLEERAGLVDDAARHALGVRHLIAHAVRCGGDFVDTVRLGIARGLSVQSAVELNLRVHRGGGLARELVYVPSLFRVRRILDAEPALESYLERGRVGLVEAAALALEGRALAGAGQPKVATTGV